MYKYICNIWSKIHWFILLYEVDMVLQIRFSFLHTIYSHRHVDVLLR